MSDKTKKKKKEIDNCKYDIPINVSRKRKEEEEMNTYQKTTDKATS
jgi:hypothetical protein